MTILWLPPLRRRNFIFILTFHPVVQFILISPFWVSNWYETGSTLKNKLKSRIKTAITPENVDVRETNINRALAGRFETIYISIPLQNRNFSVTNPTRFCKKKWFCTQNEKYVGRKPWYRDFQMSDVTHFHFNVNKHNCRCWSRKHLEPQHQRP